MIYPLNHKVSLQINLAPGDYLHTRYILPHQLKVLSPQVDEIVLVVDSKPGKGRFGENWAFNEKRFHDFLNDQIRPAYNVRIVHVDYSAAVARTLARYFFGGNQLPEKDFRGGPFYAYFFGIFNAAHRFVFHLDSDIFLGGGSTNWVAEALRVFENEPSCLIASPLPGPPHPSGIVTGQAVLQEIGRYCFQLAGMSTRIFMIDKARFAENKLVLKRPGIRNQLKATLQGNPNAELPERLLSAYLRDNNLKRIDFLGSGKGLWSLHPPYRTKGFYDNLEQIIAAIETRALPESQNGFYDIVDEVCDWSEARERLKNNRWWKRKKYDKLTD